MVSWNHPIRWSPERRKREQRRWWREASFRERALYVTVLVFIATPVWLIGATLYYTDRLLEKLHLREPMVNIPIARREE